MEINVFLYNYLSGVDNRRHVASFGNATSSQIFVRLVARIIIQICYLTRKRKNS